MSIVNMDAGVRADPFLATVKLLSDPVELEKRHAALREAEERAQKAISLAGPASEIVAMRKQIEEDLNAAKVALGEARMQAGMLVDQARVKAKEIEEESAAKRKEAEEAASALMAEARVARETAIASQADLQRLRKEYQDKLAEVDSAKTQAEHEAEMQRAARAAFEDRLSAVNDIVEQFRSALGAVKE